MFKFIRLLIPAVIGLVHYTVVTKQSKQTTMQRYPKIRVNHSTEIDFRIYFAARKGNRTG